MWVTDLGLLIYLLCVYVLYKSCHMIKTNWKKCHIVLISQRKVYITLSTKKEYNYRLPSPKLLTWAKKSVFRYRLCQEINNHATHIKIFQGHFLMCHYVFDVVVSDINVFGYSMILCLTLPSPACDLTEAMTSGCWPLGSSTPCMLWKHKVC